MPLEDLSKEQLIDELRQARSKIDKLTGILPICSSCKKIRDDAGDWHLVESYISNHTGAKFSHSLCPDCSAKLYPEAQED